MTVDEIKVSEVLNYSWKAGLVFGLSGALISGLIFGLSGGLSGGPRVELNSKIEITEIPYELWRDGLVLGLFFGLISGLSGLLGGLLLVGLFNRAFFGLPVWLRDKLDSRTNHLLLRFLLYYNGNGPLNYTRFLDHCHDRILLRKVGGGYMFVHRMLMEHFANMSAQDIKRLATAIEAERNARG